MSKLIRWPYDEADGSHTLVAFNAPHEEWSLSKPTYYVDDEVWDLWPDIGITPMFFRCILEHSPSAASEPWSGAQWETYWLLVQPSDMPSRFPTDDQCMLGVATDSAWVDEENPDTTHPGSSEDLLKWRQGPTAEFRARFPFVKFDSLPAGYGGEIEILICSIDVGMYVKNVVEPPTSWSGATLTWNNQPAWYDTYGSHPYIRPKPAQIIAGEGTAYPTRACGDRGDGLYWSSVVVPSMPGNGVILYQTGSATAFSHSYSVSLRPVVRGWKP